MLARLIWSFSFAYYSNLFGVLYTCVVQLKRYECFSNFWKYLQQHSIIVGELKHLSFIYLGDRSLLIVATLHAFSQSIFYGLQFYVNFVNFVNFHARKDNVIVFIYLTYNIIYTYKL